MVNNYIECQIGACKELRISGTLYCDWHNKKFPNDLKHEYHNLKGNKECQKCIKNNKIIEINEGDNE